MRNCLVAQSGGPTVAINASLAGVIDGVLRSDYFDNIYENWINISWDMKVVKI